MGHGICTCHMCIMHHGSWPHSGNVMLIALSRVKLSLGSLSLPPSLYIESSLPQSLKPSIFKALTSMVYLPLSSSSSLYLPSSSQALPLSQALSTFQVPTSSQALPPSLKLSLPSKFLSSSTSLSQALST